MALDPLWEALKKPGKEAARKGHEARARSILKLAKTSSSTGGRSGRRSNEMMLKVVSWGKGSRAAAAAARYIGRMREQDANEETRDKDPALLIENELGASMASADVLSAEIRSWNLMSDDLNRSKAWQLATPAERSEMDEKDALRLRQSAHLVYSVPPHLEQSPTLLKDFSATMRDHLSETYGATGHRYIWAIHKDRDGLHAHVVLKARSDTTNQSIRLGPAELQHYRTDITDRIRGAGYDVEATRRMDRPDLSREIEAGRAEARENKKTRDQFSDNERQGHTFSQAAPLWYSVHGAAYEARLAGRPADPAAEQTRWMRNSEPRFENQGKLIKALAPAFHDPREAARSYAAMAAENPRMARWALHNQPAAFGEKKNDRKVYVRADDLGELRGTLKPDDAGAQRASAQRNQRESETVQQAGGRAAAAARRSVNRTISQLELDPRTRQLAAEVRAVTDAKAQSVTPDRDPENVRGPSRDPTRDYGRDRDRSRDR